MFLLGTLSPVTAGIGGLLIGAFGAGMGMRWRTLRRSSVPSVAAVTVEPSEIATPNYDEGLLTLVRQAADALPVGVVLVSVDGTQLIGNSQAMTLLTPARPDDRVEDRSDGEIMAGGALRRLLDRAVAGERGRETLEIVGPPRRSFVVSAEPIGESSTSGFAAVAIVQDVSEQRRTEAMRQDFISNVSHELRTPVGAIAILAETLSGQTDPATTERLTGRIEHEAHRLAVMIDDLLALGNVESVGYSGADVVSVPELIDEAVERARVSAQSRGIAIRVPSPGHGLVVLGDRRQIVTALHNLLENALKYSDKGEPISVDTSVNHLGIDGASQIAIEIADRGIGIPSRDQERIFERFYRVDRARARDTGGSGLGLAIVRHVARNHRGDIAVRSVEGEGSVFTLSLPGYARVSESEPVRQVVPPPAIEGIHVSS